MDVNNIAEAKDGDSSLPVLIVEAPPIHNVSKQSNFKKKRRRGKSKRKIMKPFSKIPWQERRQHDQSKRNNRFRKIVLAKTQAPFNNNQFLMEIHKPEPENNFHNRTPSARTRDSSFSVDSEDNYFFSLPEDEEEYLTKEFSSVYEDAQSERLSNMSKNELIEEYLLLEAKYDNLVKRTERSKGREGESENTILTDKEMSITDKDSMQTDTSEASIVSGFMGETSIEELMQRLKEQEEQICELQLANEKLRLENQQLQQHSSEDSESDSSSSSDSDSSSSHCNSPDSELPTNDCENLPTGNEEQTNGEHEVIENLQAANPIVNGFHSPNE